MASSECSAGRAEDCNRLVYEAVNEISVSKFQLVISSYSEIEVLTSLAKSNEKGETPLVIAVKGGNVSLIDELVKFLKTCDRKIGKLNEMSLIAVDQLFHHQIPITELIYHLTKQLPSTNLLLIISTVVLKSTSLTRPDKITALELIGASVRNFFEGDRLLMFKCWREAMKLRYFPSDGEPLLPKTPYEGVTSAASSVVFGSAEEVMTMEELDLLEEDFERNKANRDLEVRLRCNVRMQRQCLLVIRRISSQTNYGPSFYIQRLYEFCTWKMEDYVNEIDLSTELKRIVINTFLLILEQLTGFDPQLLPCQSFNVFMKSLGFASRYLALLAKKPPGYPGREDLSHANLLAATKFIATIAKCFPNPALMSLSFINDDYDSFAEIIWDLVFVMESMSPYLNNEDKQHLEKYYSNYIRNYFSDRTTSVLHAGVQVFLDRDFPYTEYLKTIKLTIKLGADPNAIDEKGRTPLHILAGIERIDSDEYMPVFQAIVAAGAHLDMAEDNGDTVLDIVKRNGKIYKDKGVAAEAYFSSLINTVFKLSCYCARVIRRHRIPFDEDRLPLHLQELVSCHSAKGK
jgi:hypothetical protein